MLLGKKAELGLAAVQVALAPEATGTQRDLGLDDVVAGAQGVGLRIQEGEHALALVGVQVRPQHRQGRSAGEAHGHELPDPHPRHEQEGGAADQQRGGGAEVGLHENQRAW